MSVLNVSFYVLVGIVSNHNNLVISVLCWRVVPNMHLSVLLGTRLNFSRLISNVL